MRALPACSPSFLLGARPLAQLSFVSAGWMACVYPSDTLWHLLAGGPCTGSFLLESSSPSPHARSALAKATQWMPLPLEAACLLTKPEPLTSLGLSLHSPPHIAHPHITELLPPQPGTFQRAVFLSVCLSVLLTPSVLLP